MLDDRRDRSEQPVFCSQLCNLMHHIVSRGLWRNYDEPEMVKLTTCDPEASRRFTAKNAFPRFSSKSLPIVPSNRRRMFQTLFAPVRIWWNVIVTLSSLFCEVEVSLRPEKKFRPFLTNIDTLNLKTGGHSGWPFIPNMMTSCSALISRWKLSLARLTY